MTGLVADVGGTNTRLARVGPHGVLAETIQKRVNEDFATFEDLAKDYLAGQPRPEAVVVAVAGPVGGDWARLTNRDWDIRAKEISVTTGATHVRLINDLVALGHAVPGVSPEDVAALTPNSLGQGSQALVVGLGTGFNVSPVDIASGTVLASEIGHMTLPATVLDFLRDKVPDVGAFDTVENLFAGVGMLRLGRALGLDVSNAAEIANSSDPRAVAAIDICTDAFGLMLPELAYAFFPRAGFYFNGSMAKLLLAPERRARVLKRLQSDERFDGQFARLPAYLFVSDTVALGGCAAHLLSRHK